MWPEEKKELDDITLKGLKDLCRQAYTLKSEINDIDDKRKELNEKLTEIKGKISAFLEENNLPNFRSEYGLVTTIHKTSAKIDNKEALFNYLKEKADISSPAQLKKALLDVCKDLDLPSLAKDVERFLLNKGDSVRITSFPEFIRQYEF